MALQRQEGISSRQSFQSESEYSYVTRPEHLFSKAGVSGCKVPLVANYFRLKQLPEFKFIQYHVSFQPQNDFQKLLNFLIAQHRDVLGGYVYDGCSALYLTKELPEAIAKFTSKTHDGNSYELTVKKTNNVISINSHLGFTLLNLILRRAMKGLDLQLVRRNLFDPKNKIVINDFQLELWPGYVTSIRQHEDEILLCCEISHKVLRNETVYDMFRSHIQNDRNNYRENFLKEVAGAVVMTGYNNKTYRIDDVDWTKNPTATFQYGGREISFVEYYREKYNIVIKDVNQPLLVSNPSSRDVRAGRTDVLLLVPELCNTTGLTDKMRTNFQLMKAIAEYTRMDPKRRVQKLEDFSKRLNTTEACRNQFKAFQTEFQPEPVSLSGRQLKQETMLFGNGKTSVNDDRVDWTNSMKVNPMFQNEPLLRWGVIYPRRCEADTKTFLRLLAEVARGMQYDMREPKLIEMMDDRISSYSSQLEQFIQKDPKFVLVVLPNNSADRYSAVKKISCVDNAVPVQVVVLRTMQPKKGNIGSVKSIATKVLVQINCKLGGVPWSIQFPLAGTMTIGFDVTRDTITRKSYGAFIATMDIKQRVQFFSTVAPHDNSEECSAHIDTHMRKALKTYYQVNGCFPERIIMYRDGVGDGEIHYVHNNEVKTLERTLNEIYEKKSPGTAPKFSFIIVSKRINTRFFAQNRSGYENPNSGVVVDSKVTLPERYDFYLISQSVRQGTVSPTSYNIIHDTLGLSADRIQILTYKLCHLYYNWSGTTRVPCVLQYAQKLAVLVGQYLHTVPNGRMENQLYYL